jgi:putative addiction module component (TIGR02574 family)
MKKHPDKRDSDFKHPYEKEWKKEIRRRVAEIESGKVKPIDGEVVSARIRKIVNRVSPLK